MVTEYEDVEFWSARRLDRLSLACIQLAQALGVGFFVTEAFLKAAVWWRIAFVVAIFLAATLGTLLCPRHAEDVRKGGE